MGIFKFKARQIDLKTTISNNSEEIVSSAVLRKLLRVGKIMPTLENIILSNEDPWFCLATPTKTLSETNFPEYVPFLRNISAHTKWTSGLLTGTVTISATTVTGSATDFDPELSIGDLIWCNGQFRFITNRTSDIAATIDEPFTASAGSILYKITKQEQNNYNYNFPITAYQIISTTSFSLWFNEGSNTKYPENYILLNALAKCYSYDREYGTITLASSIGDIPAGDYTITNIISGNIGTSSAVITCSASGLTGGSKTSNTSNITIYPYRIAGSITTARHYEVIDAAVMSDGLYNVLGMRTRDYMQGHYHQSICNGSGATGYQANGSATNIESAQVRSPYTDGTNETPRTGPRTHPRAMIGNLYVYIGTYVE